MILYKSHTLKYRFIRLYSLSRFSRFNLFYRSSRFSGSGRLFKFSRFITICKSSKRFSRFSIFNKFKESVYSEPMFVKKYICRQSKVFGIILICNLPSCESILNISFLLLINPSNLLVGIVLFAFIGRFVEEIWMRVDCLDLS